MLRCPLWSHSPKTHSLFTVGMTIQVSDDTGDYDLAVSEVKYICYKL